MKSQLIELKKHFETSILKLNGDTAEYFCSITSEVVGNRVKLKIKLERGDEKVAKVSLFHCFNDAENIKKWNSFGYKEVPESMFEIDNLYVEPKFRNAGIGTAFLNLIMQNINNYDNKNHLESKILFIRLNTPEATAFFNKWTAHENDNSVESESVTTRMIIDKPQVISANNFTQAKSQEMQ